MELFWWSKKMELPRLIGFLGIIGCYRVLVIQGCGLRAYRVPYGASRGL